MKFAPTILATLVLTAVAAMVQDDPAVVMSVEVDVSCGNVKWKKLTVMEKAFSSKAVMDSFNKVHLDLDNGDQQLAGVHWDRLVQSSQQINEDGKDENWVGSYKKWGSGYVGTAKCNLCGRDDDNMMTSFVTSNGAALQAWESELTSVLNTSPHAGLSSATQCKIKMVPKASSAIEAMPAAAADAEEVDIENVVVAADEPVLRDDVTLPIEIDVHCTGLKFNNLSVVEAAYSSKVLQAAYNEVHEQLDNGDQMLADVHFTHTVNDDASTTTTTASPSLRSYKKWGSGYIGTAKCNLCGRDDDSTMGNFVTENIGGSLQAWESLYVSKLVEGPHAVFTTVKSCSIKMNSAARAAQE